MVSSEWSIEVFLFLQTTWIKYSAVQNSFASHPCESTTAAEKGCLCQRYHVMMEETVKSKWRPPPRHVLWITRRASSISVSEKKPDTQILKFSFESWFMKRHTMGTRNECAFGMSMLCNVHTWQLFLCRISSHSSHNTPVGVCSFRLLFPLSSSSLLLPWPWMVHFFFLVSLVQDC